MIQTLDFTKMKNLLPVIIQDERDGTVLMLGYMNEEALRRTMDEKQVVFWSRSKNRLWKKGETTGNYLNVVSIEPDCDNDALLIRVIPEGPTCHRGTQSCFTTKPTGKPDDILDELFSIILTRKEQMPAGSYTTALFTSGLSRIGQKVGEEAVELAIAAQYDDPRRCIEEAADLLYHVEVLLAAKNISLADVKEELRGRMKK